MPLNWQSAPTPTNTPYEANYPLPLGISDSHHNVNAGDNSRKFDIPAGNYVVTFQPVDVNNPGTLTLYDHSANVLVTMAMGGYAVFISGGSTGCYFSNPNGIKIAAITTPVNRGRY